MDLRDRLRGGRVLALVFLAYAGLSFILFCRNLHWHEYLLANAGGDAWSSVWFLNWWPWAAMHGHALLHSACVYAPTGYDLSWATPVPTAALLGLPVTLSAGADVTYNLLMLLSPALSAFCAFALIRRAVSTSWAVSILCGALFGFSSYENSQMSGHLNLTLTFPIPLACLLVLARLRGELGRRGFIAGLAVTLLLECGVSTEIFATFVSLGVIVWAVFLAGAGRALRPALTRTAGEAIAALVIVALLIAPLLVHLAMAAGQIPDFVNQPWIYSANLENLVIPTRLTGLGGQLFSPLSGHVSGNLSEQDSYLGLPLLIVLVLLAWERRGERLAMTLLACLALLIVASLGPSLHVGSWDSRIPLPWWIALHLPLLKGAIPGRISLYVSLCACIAASMWQAGARTAQGRVLRFALLCLCFVALLPDPRQFHWDRMKLLPFFAPAQASAALARNANVLILPYLATSDGATPCMLWQWQSGMRFRQAGGYLSFVPLPFARSQFVQHLMHNEPSQSFTNDLSAFVATKAIDAVIAGPGTSSALRAALDATAWRKEASGGVDLYHVPPLADLRYSLLGGEIWYAFGPWSWMGRSATVTTHGRSATLHLDDTLLPLPATTVTIHKEGGADTIYPLAAHSHLAITLPPDGTYSVEPGATIIPAEVFPHNTDHRVLSFVAGLEPGP